MAITIPSLKSGDTLFITLGDIAHGKKLQYLFIACWKSIIASFIDFFTQKTGPKGSRATAETAESQEKLQGVKVFCFHRTFLQLKGAASMDQNMNHSCYRLQTDGTNGSPGSEQCA